MKKILAFLLIVTMLLPMGMVAHAEGEDIKPFYLIQWGPTLEEQTNVHTMPFFWANSGKMATPLTSISYGGSYDISDIARTLKEQFDEYPDGARYFIFCLPPTAFHQTREDVLFVEKGVEICQQWLDAFLKEYKSIGGKLDVVWNLTLAANIISANVKFGQIAAIEAVKGVKEVLIETCYEPDVVKAAEKKGIKILAFSELSLIGASCYDLVKHRVIIEGAKDALIQVKRATKGVDMLVFVGLPYAVGSRIYSVAAVLYAALPAFLIPW